MKAKKHSSDGVPMGIRLTKDQRNRLQRLAKQQCNTMGGMIRLAVQQLIEKEPGFTTPKKAA